ncbi:hypothetical protein ACMFMF_003583 [Clarireedia jacksonii]
MAGRAIGMHEKEQNDGDPLEGKIPKPIRNAARSVKSVGSAPGHTGNDKDLTQTPMEEILWKKANPKQIESILNTAPHIIGEIVDKWERFANHKEQGNSSSLVVEIPFADIKQLKRATAFSVKAAEVAAHWGSGTELLGSVEIDGLNDKTWRFTALPERDELFNCLVAISGHR